MRIPIEQLEVQVAEEWQVGDMILDLNEIITLLREGGMGKVYRVYHCGSNLDLAVKCPKGKVYANQQGKDEYIREAETLVELGLRPGIAPQKLDSILRGRVISRKEVQTW